MASSYHIPRTVTNRQDNPPVNGRRPDVGAAIVKIGLARATEDTPDAKSAAIQQVADEMYREASHWRGARATRRLVQRSVGYVRHDEISRAMFVGFTGWVIAVLLSVGLWMLLVFVLSLEG